MQFQIGSDILENEIIAKSSELLAILLCDRTTEKNIFWATDNYEQLGDAYKFDGEILLESITGENGKVIMPRVQKAKTLQQSRSKQMAEVFTPSWICNAQNNGVDNAWFGKENVFNQEIILENGTKSWVTTKEKIVFPEGKIWQDYVCNTVLEITCGEAPYLASRYDTTTGAFIEMDNRIGLLDRKLRVVNENIDLEDRENWLYAVEVAYQNTYGFEWQGDNLLLAREALLITFIEHFRHRFQNEPPLENIKRIAYIISWNIWQMDGLKGVIPSSCKDETVEIVGMFETKIEIKKCQGCKTKNIKLHNGIYCKLMSWFEIDKQTNKSKIIKYIDLLKK